MSLILTYGAINVYIIHIRHKLDIIQIKTPIAYKCNNFTTYILSLIFLTIFRNIFY